MYDKLSPEARAAYDGLKMPRALLTLPASQIGRYAEEHGLELV